MYEALRLWMYVLGYIESHSEEKCKERVSLLHLSLLNLLSIESPNVHEAARV
jgi:hypothetical protein